MTLFFLMTSIVLVYPQNKKPEPVPLTRILFVLDGSQSMLSRWESGTKMQVAQKLLIDLVDSLQKVPQLEMALRVYGHHKPVTPQNCNNTKLEVPFSKRNGNEIINNLCFAHNYLCDKVLNIINLHKNKG